MKPISLSNPASPKRSRLRLRWLLFMSPLIALLIIQAVWSPVVIQVSGSVERGVWVRSWGPIEPGDHVYFAAPKSVGPVLADHGYAPTTRLFKPVLGVGGDVVLTAGPECLLNKHAVGEMDRVTSQGDPLPRSSFNGTLAPDEFWVMSSLPTSLDSRCFGPVTSAQARGPYFLAWSWPSGVPVSDRR